MREVRVAFSVAEWRERNGPQDVTLPSGSVAKLRKVHIVDLASQGLIPATLVAEADKLQGASGAALMQDLEQLKGFREMLRAVAKATFVEPPVGDEATEEQLGVDEVPFDDLVHVFNWCNGRARELEPFRAEQESDVDAVSDGEGVREAAKPDSGD